MSTTVEGDGTSEVSEDAAELRFAIDALDQDLAALLVRRRDLSTSIQRQRVRSGGPRTDLSRENEILNNYQLILGLDGKDIGLAVLTFCRGDGNANGDESEG